VEKTVLYESTIDTVIKGLKMAPAAD